MKVQCNGDINMCCHQIFKFIGNLQQSTWQEIWFGSVAEQENFRIFQKMTQEAKALANSLGLNLYMPRPLSGDSDLKLYQLSFA